MQALEVSNPSVGGCWTCSKHSLYVFNTEVNTPVRHLPRQPTTHPSFCVEYQKKFAVCSCRTTQNVADGTFTFGAIWRYSGMLISSLDNTLIAGEWCCAMIEQLACVLSLKAKKVGYASFFLHLPCRLLCWCSTFVRYFTLWRLVINWARQFPLAKKKKTKSMRLIYYLNVTYNSFCKFKCCSFGGRSSFLSIFY